MKIKIIEVNRKELSKDIQWQYREMNKLFVNKKLGERKLADRFLDVFEEIYKKVDILLSWKNIREENLEKLLQNSFKKAIEAIIRISERNIEELDYSIFISRKIKNSITYIKRDWENRERKKTADKYKIFLTVLNNLYFGDKTVKIKHSKEKVSRKKYRHFPYYITQIKLKKRTLTVLICDEIWEATYVYNTHVDKEEFKKIEKGQVINWVEPIRVPFWKDYSKIFSEILSVKENEQFLETISSSDLEKQENDYYEEVYYTKMLWSITDKAWNKLNIDLETIKLEDFKFIYFWYNTGYWVLSWQTLLKDFWWNSIRAFNKLLKAWWIERKDLWYKEIDPNNKENIIELLNMPVDRNNKQLEIDYKTIWIRDFKAIHFWYATEFRMMTGQTLLWLCWPTKAEAFRYILESYWEKERSITYEQIDYNNSEHISEILKLPVNKKKQKLEVDYQTIWVQAFAWLYFWYWSNFKMITWQRLLWHHWGMSKASLKSILKLNWVERKELWSEQIDFKDNTQLIEILKIITDKNWNKQEVDLKTISMTKFSKLYFWYGSKYWYVYWEKILTKLWWINNKIFKKLLRKIWIDRKDIGIVKIDYNNREHIKELLLSSTDKDWNQVNVDYTDINLTDFKSLYMWYATKFWIIWAQTMLTQTLWPNTKSLQKILSLWKSYFDILFSSITDKDWNSLDLDINTITTEEFSNAYFWYNTEYKMISWKSLLRKYWWKSRIILKKVLSVWAIERKDLPIEEIDLDNKKYLKEIFRNIYDREWNKVKVDFKKILMKDFIKLSFWNGTRFWSNYWERILIHYWWKNRKSLQKILSFIKR